MMAGLTGYLLVAGNEFKTSKGEHLRKTGRAR